MTRYFRAGPMLVLSALALMGCQQSSNKIVMCPVASILADTAAYPGFRPGAEGDPAGELYNVKVTGVTTDCNYSAGSARTDSEVQLTFRATRTPTGDAASYSVPYYVAVTYGSQILVKQTFSVNFAFRPGASIAEFNASVDSIVTQIEAGKLPYDYQILVGMQLTEGQLNYVKQMGRFTP